MVAQAPLLDLTFGGLPFDVNPHNVTKKLECRIRRYALVLFPNAQLSVSQAADFASNTIQHPSYQSRRRKATGQG